MTLRNRFTLISSLSFGIVAIITFLIVFLAYYDSTKNSYFKELKNVSLIAAIYYLEKDELPQYKHTEVKKQYRSLIESQMVAVYNKSDSVAFGKLVNDKAITHGYLDFARKNKSVQFMAEDYFYYGIYYPDNQGDFVVVVKASAQEFQSQILRLLVIVLLVLILGLITIFFLSRYLSKIVYQPLSNVVEQINSADYNTISRAITSSNTNDEIDELIKSYNKLLGRISENILVQQNFINYVSHEFKTPLASISGNLEVFAQKDRSPEEYHQVVKQSLKDVFYIESILNNLLMMSGLRDKEHTFSKFRLDEVIWNIYEDLQPKALQNKTMIKVSLEVQDPLLLEFNGNETLLHLAIYNLVENAIKYSAQKPIELILSDEKSFLEIIIKDNGIGISKEELDKITTTFYRGKNVDNIKGSGIGLSLAKNILDYYSIHLQITSDVGVGTEVKLSFK
ncbi:sensor histidine kinase [Chryseobacterium sp. T1]